MAIPSSEVTPVISPQSWVLVVTLSPQRLWIRGQKLHPQEGKINQLQAEAKQTRTATPTAISKPQTTPQPVMKLYSIGTDDNRTFAVSLSEAADNIIRQECSLEEATHWLSWKRYSTTGTSVFAGYLDAATSMAVSSGGGGSDTGGWGRDKDEDELEWARRCARMANQMCKRRKGFTDIFQPNIKRHEHRKTKEWPHRPERSDERDRERPSDNCGIGCHW